MGQLGGQVDGRRGQQDVLLQGAVVVLLAHQRQVVNELKRRECNNVKEERKCVAQIKITLEGMANTGLSKECLNTPK